MWDWEAWGQWVIDSMDNRVAQKPQVNDSTDNTNNGKK